VCSSGGEAEVEGPVVDAIVSADGGSGKREISFSSVEGIVRSAIDGPLGVVAASDAGELCTFSQGHGSIFGMNVDDCQEEGEGQRTTSTTTHDAHTHTLTHVYQKDHEMCVQ